MTGGELPREDVADAAVGALFEAMLDPTYAFGSIGAAATILRENARLDGHNFAAHLALIALEFGWANKAGPSTREIRNAVRDISASCRAIDRSLETLLAAVQTTDPHSARGSRLKALFSDLLEAMLPGIAFAPWTDDISEAPLRREFLRIAKRVDAAAGSLSIDSLRQPTRSPSLAVDTLIARLSDEWKAATGARPSAAGKSGHPAYRPPFSRLVSAFWPAVSSLAPPSNGVIARALARSHALERGREANTEDRHEKEVSSHSRKSKKGPQHYAPDR